MISFEGLPFIEVNLYSEPERILPVELLAKYSKTDTYDRDARQIRGNKKQRE